MLPAVRLGAVACRPNRGRSLSEGAHRSRSRRRPPCSPPPGARACRAGSRGWAPARGAPTRPAGGGAARVGLQSVALLSAGRSKEALPPMPHPLHPPSFGYHSKSLLGGVGGAPARGTRRRSRSCPSRHLFGNRGKKAESWRACSTELAPAKAASTRSQQPLERERQGRLPKGLTADAAPGAEALGQHGGRGLRHGRARHEHACGHAKTGHAQASRGALGEHTTPSPEMPSPMPHAHLPPPAAP